MQNYRKDKMNMKYCLIAGLLLGFCSLSAIGESPVISMRLRMLHTATEEQWQKTFAALKENPGCCDEVWFSTGIGLPPLQHHRDHARRLAVYAAQLRKLGITPSLQIQATLGHGDELSALEDCSAKNWTGWTGSTGVEDKYCSCPRQSAFLSYICEMAGIYASFQPGSVWIDDDLRIEHHRPATDNSRAGCWCKTCIAAFNSKTAGNWTRETLNAAMAGDAGLEAEWCAFSIEAIAAIAKAIAAEVHARSPETMMALQNCFDFRNFDKTRAIVTAMHEATGSKVGLRPGGGAYYDINPNDQVIKSLTAVNFRAKLGNMPEVGVWCPEVESWPRAYCSRSAQSAIIESFVALAYGFNSTSLFILDTRNESDELYSRTLLRPIADAAPVLKGLTAQNKGAVAAGFVAQGVNVPQMYRFALSGVPMLIGPGRSCGELKGKELSFDICQTGSKDIQALRDELDKRAGGLPAVLESPFVGLMLPYVGENDGALRSVALLNTRIDMQGPIVLRLRDLAPGAKAVWHELRRPSMPIEIERTGDISRVTIPAIGAWNGGYLAIYADIR